MRRIRFLTLGFVAVAAVLACSLPASAQQSATRALSVTVTAGKPSEFGYKLSTKTVKHGMVIFKVTNRGTIPHNFKVCSSNKGGTRNSCIGKSTATLSPGKSANLIVTFTKAGSYEYLCTIPGHAAAGMKGILKVT